MKTLKFFSLFVILFFCCAIPSKKDKECKNCIGSFLIADNEICTSNEGRLYIAGFMLPAGNTSGQRSFYLYEINDSTGGCDVENTYSCMLKNYVFMDNSSFSFSDGGLLVEFKTITSELKSLFIKLEHDQLVSLEEKVSNFESSLEPQLMEYAKGNNEYILKKMSEEANE